ncbi:MAG: hypothetical protein SVU32_06735 [Candidatus Nanohaloarchaea archaeon]|nr:hypothetical protein [Candidatus Nanohaloarchaea archaeon]
MRWAVVLIMLMLAPLGAAATVKNPYCTVWGSVQGVAGSKAARVQVMNISVAERSAANYTKDDCMVSSGKIQPFKLASKPSGMSTGDTIRGVAHFENGMILQEITIVKDVGSSSGPLAALGGIFAGLLNAIGL